MLKQSEVRDQLAEKLEISKVDADKFIKTYVDTIKDDLFATGKSKIPGVGILEIRYRAEREGRNPQTKETLVIPETLTAGLSISSLLKDEIKEKVQIDSYRK